MFPGCVGVAVTLPLTIVLGGKNPTLHLHAVPLGCHSLITSGSQAGRYLTKRKQRQKTKKRKTSKSNKTRIVFLTKFIGTSVPTSLHAKCTTIFTSPPDSMSMTKRPQSECDSHIEVCGRKWASPFCQPSCGLGYLTPTKTLIWSYSKLR